MPSPIEAIAANVVKSKSGTLAVLPLMLASAAVTSYARSTAASHHAQAAAVSAEAQALEAAHDAEALHQHVVLPRTTERESSASSDRRKTLMLAPRKKLHSTPLRVFSGALELLRITPSDVLYDVGCGDGRLVVRAAQTHGIRAVGIEIDHERVVQARRAAQEAGVAHLVTIHHGNALDFDLSDATIVFLFLIERGLGLLQSTLEQLPAPCRVVTYLYRFPGALRPDAKHFLRARDSSEEVAFPVFLYSFPTAATRDKEGGGGGAVLAETAGPSVVATAEEEGRDKGEGRGTRALDTRVSVE
ncbi:hypothetical protein PybrP1_004115 [[Pythium] brassicae (nom. inval.)]|nr:hypothetical protein PybrP1_004115 [[Pythium] brassicae (nom. inval.)]